MVTKVNKLTKVLSEFPLFAKNFIFITDNENQVIKFEINEAQQEIENLMLENRFVVIGKARQAGISTFVLARALWRALTKPNENILIVSYKGDSAKALFEKLKQMNDAVPRDKFPHVFPNVRRDNRSELLFTNGSRISSVTAGTKILGVVQRILMSIYLSLLSMLHRKRNYSQLNNPLQKELRAN